MHKTLTIKQPGGIGDIFYTQKIAKKILSNKIADRVLWPVFPTFHYISNYINYPGLFFESELQFSQYALKNFEVVNLQDADRIHPDVSLMTAKYKLVGLDESDWVDYFEFNRDLGRENKLFELLQLDKDSEYILTSQMYGSPPHSKRRNIKFENPDNKRVVNIQYFNGVNIFDWCGVLENASEIYMIDTSFMYLMEKLNLKSKKNCLYSRYNPANFNVVKHIPQNVNWEYISWEQSEHSI